MRNYIWKFWHMSSIRLAEGFTLATGGLSVRRGFTLIEVVVAVGVFALLSIILSLLLVGSLRGSKKAAASILVRGEGAYALENMTSLLRYFSTISVCNGSNLVATNQKGEVLNLACIQAGADRYLASNSARLTSSKTQVVSCANVFACSTDFRSLHITFGLQTAGNDNPIENASTITFDSEVGLRNY